MIATHRTTVRLQHRERIPTATGFTTKSLPDTHEKIIVEVDLEAIASNIGARAWHNKSGKAKYLKGAVVIRRA